MIKCSEIPKSFENNLNKSIVLINEFQKEFILLINDLKLQIENLKNFSIKNFNDNLFIEIFKKYKNKDDNDNFILTSNNIENGLYDKINDFILNFQKNINLKIETKDTNNIAKYISGDEQLIRNKLIMSKNDLDSDSPSRLKMNSNEINNSDQKGSLALALSPIKKGVRKRNMLVDIMEKSKKNNAPKRSVLFPQEFKLKEENAKNERKDVYGVPINRREEGKRRKSKEEKRRKRKRKKRKRNNKYKRKRY
jgi:hypothetical protein